MTSPASGRCLCGDFTYQFDRETVISAHHCHCKDCQRMTGSGKATIVLVPTEALPTIVREAFTEAGWECECWLESSSRPPPKPAPDPWDSAIDPDEITPCPKCGTLEAWWGGTGRQRCLRCDPPTRARRLAEKTKLPKNRGI